MWNSQSNDRPELGAAIRTSSGVEVGADGVVHWLRTGMPSDDEQEVARVAASFSTPLDGSGWDECGQTAFVDPPAPN